jgi:NitT/TauT family transport system substrate-binding protein
MVVLTTFLAAGLAGCRPAPPLVVGTPHLPATALLYLAERNGCLADGDPKIVLRNYPSGRDAMVALRQGEVEAAAAYQTPFIFNAFEDPSLRILTTLHSSVRASYLVGRRDRGIRSGADLKGKRIGYPPRTSADYLVRSLLAFEGLSVKDVTLVEIAPADAAAHLKAGRVDAVANWSPHIDAAAAALEPANRQVIYSDVYDEMSLIATRQDVRERREKVLHRLVRCTAQAARELDALPDRGLRMAAQVFPQLPPEQLQSQWAEITHHVGLSNALLSVLTHEAEWLAAAQQPRVRVPAFADMLDAEFLQAVAPETITAMRRR